jgi:hypothetical protein
MPVSRPFKRTARPQAGSTYPGSNYLGQCHYIKHPKYAVSPEHYVRAFRVLQKDLLELFDYVEPADKNEDCYSYRIHELHTRACIEVEANCKAILFENGCKAGAKVRNWDMRDYRKLNKTHRLSSFQVRLPNWSGKNDTRAPLAEWKKGGQGLSWYQAYNCAKHSRHEHFEKSNFRNMLEAMCGLVVILASQFITIDFGPEGYFGYSSPTKGYEIAIGGYFEIKFPEDWPQEDWYMWKWEDILHDAEPFQKLFTSQSATP